MPNVAEAARVFRAAQKERDEAIAEQQRLAGKKGWGKEHANQRAARAQSAFDDAGRELDLALAEAGLTAGGSRPYVATGAGRPAQRGTP